MAVTIDGENLLVILESGVTSVSVQDDLYEYWKQWIQLSDNAKYPQMFRSIGGDPLGGGLNAGDYYFFFNFWTSSGSPPQTGWRIKPPEEDIIITLVGNLFPEDPNQDWLVPTDGNFNTSVRLQTSQLTQTVEPTAIAQSVWEYDASVAVDGTYGSINRTEAFGGAVWVNTTTGTAGTLFPTGTASNPVSNISDAITIALVEGVNRIKVVGDATISSTDIVDRFIIEGSGINDSIITVQSGASTQSTQFFNCTITGTLGGQVIVRESALDNVSNLQGVVHESMLNGGVIGISGTQPVHFLSCYTADMDVGSPAITLPQIDFNGANVPLVIRDYTGEVQLINKTGDKKAIVEFNTGELIVDSSTTAGEIIVRGIYELTGTVGGTATITQATNLDSIETKVDAIGTIVASTDSKVDLIQIDITNILDVIDTIRKYHTNRSFIDKNNYTLTIYEDNGTTPHKVFDLKDDNGVASITKIFERIPQ